MNLEQQIIQQYYPFIILGIILSLVWLSQLIDIIRNDFKNPNNKVIWIIILILLPFPGSILYGIMGNKQKNKKTPEYPHSLLHIKKNYDQSQDWKI